MKLLKPIIKDNNRKATILKNYGTQLFLGKLLLTIFITLRGLIFAWINFRDFANFWTFREN